MILGDCLDQPDYSQPPIIAASRKSAANIVFGTLSATATTESSFPSPVRSARIDHTHPTTHAAHHASGTSLTISGGNGTAAKYEKYAAPTADEASTTSKARPPLDICVLPSPKSLFDRVLIEPV